MQGELFGAFPLLERFLLDALQRKIEMVRKMEKARDMEMGRKMEKEMGREKERVGEGDSRGKLEIEICKGRFRRICISMYICVNISAERLFTY